MTVQAELTPAALVLLAFLAGLLGHDFMTRGKSRRLLTLQLLVFAAGAALIVYPEIARRLARLVGIGRGVDFVLYPLVILLVREALLSRSRRHEEEERLTEVVRTLATERARQAASPPR
jgi:small membrane protein